MLDKVVAEAVKQALKLFQGGRIGPKELSRAADRVMKVATKAARAAKK